jgi:peptidoglycan/xylan/chitin deacetylase (PgdA/CDA1 family)
MHIAVLSGMGLGACTVRQDNLPGVGPPGGGSGGAGGESPGPGTGAPLPVGGGGDAGTSVTGQGPVDGPTLAADSRPADVTIAVPAGPTFTLTGIATWRGAAEGAYSIILDGVCDSDGAFTHADGELTRRGLHGGFGVIVSSCGAAPGGKWPQVKTLVSHGHDVFNQSWSHPCLGTARECGGNGPPSADLAEQIDHSTQVLEDTLGVPIKYFIFPYDVCGADAVAHLRQRGYLGARCGTRGISAPTFPDGFATRFDIWGPAFSIYGNAGPCKGLVMALNTNVPPASLPAACRSFVLDQYVEDAIAGKGWAIRALTGFLDDRNAFQPMSLADYTAHLDHVRAKVDAGLLWVEGPTPVLKYRWAREKCAAPVVMGGNTLHFAEPSADCRTYATTLSYLVATADQSDPATLGVTQATGTVAARKLGPGRFVVDVDPTRGDAVLQTAPAAP